VSRLIILLLLIAGLLKLYPLIGVLSAAQLAALYGMPFDNPDLVILMRHRAVLFGLLGGLILASAFRRALRPMAIGAGIVSALSFILLAVQTGDYGNDIRFLMRADVVVLLCLLAAHTLGLRTPAAARNATPPA
jgi:hypothetical protein